MSRMIILDSEGNDITPFCWIADAIILEEKDCVDCKFKEDGCRYEHNMRRYKDD